MGTRICSVTIDADIPDLAMTLREGLANFARRPSFHSLETTSDSLASAGNAGFCFGTPIWKIRKPDRPLPRIISVMGAEVPLWSMLTKNEAKQAMDHCMVPTREEAVPARCP